MCKPDSLEKTQNRIVNSWNEWDPLKHVIVGVATGTVVQAPEPAVQRDFPEHGFPFPKSGPLPQEMVDKANEQLDNFASLLQKRGIKVDRPELIDFNQRVSTPDWVQDTMFGCMPPRDLLLTVGHEILEATMSYRSRWFEYLCYRPLLEKYFKDDPGFRWEAAPKPRLGESTYVPGFWEEFNALSDEERIERFTKRKSWATTEQEVLFDAADIGRYGKDLFAQRSMTTNGAGIDWLRRHFPGHRVHEMLFYEADPIHIDATFIPLRPGLALSNPVRPPLFQEMLDLFKLNDWEIVKAAPAAHDHKSPLSYCSVWLSMNTLMLDEKTICVEEQEKLQMEQLYKLGFEVIPVPFYDVNAFGGGLHCATADVYREGNLQDYFPKQIKGY
jgi:glycine amidinotransferase